VVQLRDHPGVVRTERPAPVGQDPQHRELLVVDDRTQAGHQGPDKSDRVRVGGVGLAALPGGEHPHPRRQLRWHVHHLLAVGQQSRGDVPSDAAAALNGPDPLMPVPRPTQHRGVAGWVGGVAATVDHRLVRRHHLDRDRPLVRIHADDHACHVCPPCPDFRSW